MRDRVSSALIGHPLTAGHLRLSITDSWDRIRPPRTVRVAEPQARR